MTDNTPAKPANKQVNDRAEAILKQMTLEEKIDYIGGFREFNIRPVQRLGVPEIRTADGPLGVRNFAPSPAYPATIGLSASFNPELAAAFGTSIGRDCRARGVHILLAPGVNIHRSPLCGRNFEYLGEDPFLSATMVVPIIKGVQSQGVLATVKHFAANNQEYDRHHTSSDLDARTLREIYLPAFEAAVRKAKVACVMNAYGLINGTHCTQHDELNNKILKGEWGFDGILMSDWVATYDAVAAANGGLDLEMPSAKWMNREFLLPAIKEGKVKEKTIDEKVRRILRTIIRAGFFDRQQTDQTIPNYDPSSARTALRMARESAVLLKNDGNMLPLDTRKLRSIAVIGPNAHPAVSGAGGSSQVAPHRATSIVQGLTGLLGDKVNVFMARGSIGDEALPLFANSYFTCTDDAGNATQGLRAEYFESRDLSGQPKVRRIDRQVNFDWGHSRPDFLPREGFSARWTGELMPVQNGLYMLVARADDGIRVWLDDELVIDDWSQHAARCVGAQKQLEGGRTYRLRIEYFDVGGMCTAQFGWGELAEPAQAAAVRIASQADAVVLCIGFNDANEGEGFDRTFALPAGQEELIREVCAANPNTVAVLFAGGAVETAGWLDKVKGLLHVWYPGQEGGQAIAEVLLGMTNPSGKLPMTWGKKLGDWPSTASYHAPAGAKAAKYEEGIFVGYRGFEKKGVAPLFPFGFGLSYTTFGYENLLVSPAAVGPTGKVKVSFDVANTGTRAGAETAQVYVGKVGGGAVERAVKELKGFKKVQLAKGKRKNITVTIDAASLAYWDTQAAKWVVEPGQYEVSVGASAGDIRLTGKFTIGG